MHIQDMAVPLGDGVIIEARRIQHGATAGPTLVFLHESLGNIGLWRSFPERLAKATGLDALIYNRRGYGESSDELLPRPYDYLEQEGAVVLPRLLDRLGIAEVALIGHSDGGSVALVAAGAMPGKVKALLTMAAHTYVDHLTTAGIEAMAVRYRETDLREKLRRHHGARTDQLFRAWQQVWLDPGFHQSLDFGHWLAAIECPAMIIQGEADEYGIPEQVTDIAAGIGASAREVFLPGTGHAPHLEKTEEVLELMYDFLTRQASLKGQINY